MIGAMNRPRSSRLGRIGLWIAVVITISVPAPANAITNGTLDDDGHPYVGLVTSDFITGCSGSLLTSTVFLTAGHCASDGQRVFVTTASDVFSPNATVVTGIAHVEPGFGCCATALPGFVTHDAAVVTLERRIRSPRYAQLPGTGQVDSLRTGQDLTIVGYGAQGVVSSSKALIVDGERYTARVALHAAGSSFDASFVKLSANPAQGKGGTCFGDSGGPDLLDDTAVAVNSFLPDLLCTGVTYGYRVDQAATLAFIRSFM
jgi:hypothetical protein